VATATLDPFHDLNMRAGWGSLGTLGKRLDSLGEQCRAVHDRTAASGADRVSAGASFVALRGRSDLFGKRHLSSQIIS